LGIGGDKECPFLQHHHYQVQQGKDEELKSVERLNGESKLESKNHNNESQGME